MHNDIQASFNASGHISITWNLPICTALRRARIPDTSLLMVCLTVLYVNHAAGLQIRQPGPLYGFDSALEGEDTHEFLWTKCW